MPFGLTPFPTPPSSSGRERLRPAASAASAPIAPTRDTTAVVMFVSYRMILSSTSGDGSTAAACRASSSAASRFSQCLLPNSAKGQFAVNKSQCLFLIFLPPAWLPPPRSEFCDNRSRSFSNISDMMCSFAIVHEFCMAASVNSPSCSTWARTSRSHPATMRIP